MIVWKSKNKYNSLISLIETLCCCINIVDRTINLYSCDFDVQIYLFNKKYGAGNNIVLPISE